MLEVYIMLPLVFPAYRDVVKAAARTLSVTSSEEVGWDHSACWGRDKAVAVVGG